MKRSVHISKADYTFFGAFVALFVLAVWCLVILWVHMVTPYGMNIEEIPFLGTLTVIFWVLVPLYWFRVRWGYIAGMIVIAVGFVGGGIASVLSHVVHFSWSVYNVVVVMMYIIALTCLYLSNQCYEKLPNTPAKKVLLGVGGIVLMMVITAAVLSFYSKTLYWDTMYNATLETIDHNFQDMDTVDEKMQYLVDVGDVPSVVAGIVINDNLVWAKAYGNATIDTVYLIGSVSKPFTATAVLQLYEQGLLGLDDDINMYLPFTVRHPQYPDTSITIRMLLTHQSGLNGSIPQHEQYMDDPVLREWATSHFGLEYPAYDLSLDLFLEELLIPGGAYYSPDVWTDAGPGTYTYSNVGYDLLGYIVEQVTEKSFPEYLQRNIFDPLAMTQTGVSACALDASPYERVFALLSKTNVKLPVYDRLHTGAGGIRSTVPDLAQFLIAHMNQGQALNGYQLLSPETVQLMHEPAVSVFTNTSMAGYGLGWEHRSTEPGQYLYMHGSQGHSGGTEGYTCQMWMVETKKGSYGVIVMTNIYHYYKSDPLWMRAWNYKMQDILLTEAAEMLAHRVLQIRGVCCL